MMDIPVNVDVFCLDGQGGRSTSIIVNPISMTLTHVVVRFNKEEFLVPLELVTDSSSTIINLNCSQQELLQQRRFIKTQFIGAEEFDVENDLRRMAVESDANYWPYRSLDKSYLEIYGSFEQIPHNELAIHRGSLVEASDGQIGRVEEFVVDSTNHHITHLVLKRGHFWGQKEITIPVNEIDQIDEDIVYLKLDKQGVKSLPAIPGRPKDRE